MTPPARATVQRINPLEGADWEDSLAARGDASFFHGTSWARVLHDTYRHQPCYLRFSQPDRPDLLLPLMEVNSWLTGRRGVSLPFTDECTLLGDDLATIRFALNRLFALSREQRWRYFELRSGKIAEPDLPPSVSFHGHTLDLEPDTAKLFSRFYGSVRTAVRKAEHAGLTVDFTSGLEEVRTFYDLLCKTRRKLGAPPQPFRFFENIHRHVLSPKQGFVALARSAGVPVAGAIFFQRGKTAIYKFAASDSDRRDLQGNNLVLWRSIEKCAKEGASSLDFGRTSLANSGLRRFKLGWSTKEHRVDYVRYQCDTNAFVRSEDRASGWQTRVFKFLPASISKTLGAAAYSHFA